MISAAVLVITSGSGRVFNAVAQTVHELGSKHAVVLHGATPSDLVTTMAAMRAAHRPLRLILVQAMFAQMLAPTLMQLGVPVVVLGCSGADTAEALGCSGTLVSKAGCAAHLPMHECRKGAKQVWLLLLPKGRGHVP